MYKDLVEVSIKIIQARHLRIEANSNTFVEVHLAGKSKTTRPAKFSDSPFFNEFFVFDFKEDDFDTFLEHTMEIQVKSGRGLLSRSQKVSEFSITLLEVYNQPSHQIYRKWAPLSHPKNLSSGTQGFIKCDIRILRSGETVDQPLQTDFEDEDLIEENLIHGRGVEVGEKRQLAEYVVNVHSAEDLVKFGKSKLNSQVSISISDLKGQTCIVNNSQDPVWNETLTFTAFYPPMWNRIRIHLISISKIGSKVISEHCIPIEQLSNFDASISKEFAPEFGPAYIHLYSETKVYMGRILLSIHTNVLQEDQVGKSGKIRKVEVTKQDVLGLTSGANEMVFFCALLEATLQGVKMEKKKFRIEAALAPPNCIAKSDVSSAIGCTKGDQGFYSLCVLKSVPCLSIISKWPDRRFSIFKCNQLNAAIKLMKGAVAHKQNLTDILRDTLQILDTVKRQKTEDFINEGDNFTNLDALKSSFTKKILAAVMTEIETTMRADGQVEMNIVQKICDQLELCTFDPQQFGVPDVSIRLLSAQGKLLGDHRVPVEQIICSANPLEAGPISAKPITVFLQKRVGKKDKKGWNLISKAKLRLLMWFGLPSEVPQLLLKLPNASNLVDRLPLMLNFTEKRLYECQAHIYHGNVVAGWDINTLADPFIRISIGSKSVLSEVKKETLAPEWNQAIVMWPIIVWGTSMRENPPLIDMELFDHKIGKPAEFIGRCAVTPLVAGFSPVEILPKWYIIKRGAKITANILASFQIVKKRENEEASIPQLTPLVMCEYKMEILMWGLESEHKLKNPMVSIEIGSQTVGSASILDFSNYAHFDQPHITLNLTLPSDPSYLPPIIVKLFCQKSAVEFEAIGVITNPSKFLEVEENNLIAIESSEEPTTICIAGNPYELNVSIGEEVEEKKEGAAATINISEDESDSTSTTPLLRKYSDLVLSIETPGVLKELCEKFKQWDYGKADNDTCVRRVPDEVLEFDWWSKFYASEKIAIVEDPKAPVSIQLFSGELEEQPEFDHFSDVVQSYPLVSGLRHMEEEPSEKAKFVGNFQLTCLRNKEEDSNYKLQLPPLFSKHRETCVVVRVYVVRALRLRPKDKNGLSDPYIVISSDKGVLVKDRDNYIPENLDPSFGRCFALELSLPEDHTINIGVYDRNEAMSDEFMGETKVNLERRLMTKHRAHCGISQRHNLNGYNSWRDGETPSEILRQLCATHQIEPFVYNQSELRVGNILIRGSEDTTNEQLSLEALKNWHKIGGWELVPEHVESRPLFHPKKPGVEQGRLQMWVDLFPTSGAVPGPQVDITPRAPKEYELRVIVWMTEDIPLEDTNIMGTKMSDIYFRLWLGENGKKQSTDIHHRSLTGEGLFNWRLIFPFKYLHAEHSLVLEHTGFSSLFSSRKKLVPCVLNVQAWDADIITADDFLGSTSLDLSKMPRGAKTSTLCDENQDGEFVNLFLVRKTRGWWALHDSKGMPAGKVELQFELLTKKEAEEHPAGKGRSAPNALPSPNRPDTSFSWLLNPARAARVVLWRRFGRKILIFLVVGAALAILVYAFLSIPTVVVHEFVSKLIR